MFRKSFIHIVRPRTSYEKGFIDNLPPLEIFIIIEDIPSGQ